MNPFDLPGPTFLVFYGLLILAVHLAWQPLLCLSWFGNGGRGLSAGRFDLGNLDPYLVAYLRGGEAETARVVIVSLLDRGLLRADLDQLCAVPGAAHKAARPVERVLLEAFASKQAASVIFKDAAFRRACGALAAELERLGLIRSAVVRGWAAMGRMLAIALLAGVAVVKIAIVVARGHHNFGFLVFMMLIAVMTTVRRPMPMQTRSGERLLADLKLRFRRLEQRSERIELGGASRELVILAAVFGLAALPTALHTELTVLFPLGMRNAAAGSSCGSSCGTSSLASSCGGSSCGGGGCGGGCGGCG